MKERPIIFSAPMVRAILAGQKTQTRRIFKMPKGMAWYCSGALRGEETGDLHDVAGPGWCSIDELSCPHGRAGDRLWVREAWARTKVAQDATEADFFVYREADSRTDYGGPWKPSIHMPRAASRISLTITGVRVERLQTISRGDSMAEGCPFPNMAGGDDPRQWFADLWTQLNGPDSLAANPWVWVVEFKRVPP